MLATGAPTVFVHEEVDNAVAHVQHVMLGRKASLDVALLDTWQAPACVGALGDLRLSLAVYHVPLYHTHALVRLWTSFLHHLR